MFDLFPSPLVAGLKLERDVIEVVEEPALTTFIDGAGLAPFRFQGWLGKRLTASFGWSYDFDRARISAERPMPDELISLRKRMAALAQVDPAELMQALVIRYDPGAGIGWHRDRPQFGTVIGLSLGAPAILRLRRRREDGKFDRENVELEPRSAYVLDGEVRHEWEHSIAPIAATRWSITFRTLSDLGRRAII